MQCPYCGKAVELVKGTDYTGVQQKFSEKVGPDYHRSNTGGSVACKFCGQQILWPVDRKQGDPPKNPDGTDHRCRSR